MTENVFKSAEVWLPVLTFIVGWGSGVITAWAMYRDHDRRLQNVEKLVASLAELGQKDRQDIAVLYEKVRDLA